MSDDFYIKQHKKTVISSNRCNSSIEIGDYAIDQGFLLQFPGVSLALFLYLITHANERHVLETNPTIISTYLPNSYNIADINGGLKYLEKHDIIELSQKRDGDYTYQIRVNPANLGNGFARQGKAKTLDHDLPQEQNTINSNTDPQNNEERPECLYYDQREIRKKVLTITDPSRSELFQAILTFIPPEENITLLETTINQWLEDFDCKLIKELIRRVNKWLEKYNNPTDRAFHYLKGIIDDWYQKEIGSYQDLKYFDQLFRETRELAQIYGLVDWHNVKPIHMKTFSRWLNEDFPLSIAVVKFAIKEAFRRKKDGQPSLKYIEDNFINLWKKNKVRDCQQALSLLKKNDAKSHRRKVSTGSKAKSNNSKQGTWEDFSWDFE